MSRVLPEQDDDRDVRVVAQWQEHCTGVRCWSPALESCPGVLRWSPALESCAGVLRWSPVLLCWTLGKFIYSALLQFTQLQEDIDRGRYLCMNSLHTLIAAWLHVSQRSQDGACSTWSDREECENISLLSSGHCTVLECNLFNRRGLLDTYSWHCVGCRTSSASIPTSTRASSLLCVRTLTHLMNQRPGQWSPNIIISLPCHMSLGHSKGPIKSQNYRINQVHVWKQKTENWQHLDGLVLLCQ